MSRYRDNANKKAVALRYDSNSSAPVIVASGLGYMAEKIVEIAVDKNLPVYEDTSLATVLSQLQVGTQIPEELYQAIVEIYVYFLKGCQTPTPLNSEGAVTNEDNSSATAENQESNS